MNPFVRKTEPPKPKTGGGGEAMPKFLRLKQGAMNVAGEDHEESDTGDRRKIEKLMGDELFGGYWEEDEFEAKDPSTGGVMYGDPTVLRICQDLTFIDSYMKYIGTEKEALELHRKYLLSIATMLGKMQAGKDGLDMHEDQRQGIIDTFSTVLEAAVTALENYAGNKNPANLEAYKKAIGELVGSAAYLMDPEEFKKDDVAVKRSFYMDIAAEMGAVQGKRGIWKIGDTHVTHIRKNSKPANYNLVNQVQFDADFDGFLKAMPVDSGARSAADAEFDEEESGDDD